MGEAWGRVLSRQIAPIRKRVWPRWQHRSNATGRRATGIGRRGRAWAEGQTVERYARDILDVVGQVNDWRVMSVAIDRLGTALGELGARPDLPVCDEALAQLERFAGPRAGTG